LGKGKVLSSFAAKTNSKARRRKKNVDASSAFFL